MIDVADGGQPIYPDSVPAADISEDEYSLRHNDLVAVLGPAIPVVAGARMLSNAG